MYCVQFLRVLYVLFVGKEWKCYVCDDTLLKPLRAECRKVMDHMETEEKRAKEKTKQLTNGGSKSGSLKESNEAVKAAPETKAESKPKPKENKQLLKVLSSSNPSSRSSSPSEFQKTILTQPHAGTTINTEKIIIDTKTGNTTKFEMVYPNASVVRTQYKPVSRPISKPVSSEGAVSMSFTGLLPGNIHSIITNLLSMTNNLQELLKNIQENVISESNLDKLPFEISLRTLSQQQLQARLTATNMVKNGVNLFLQEMAMKTSAAGVKALNLSQQGSQPNLASSLLAGKPLDRNGGAMNIDTPQKFDRPGGTNSPLLTSTPNCKSTEEDSDIEVLDSTPGKKEAQKSEIISTSQNSTNDDTMVNENELAEKELLKDAAEEVGSEVNDSEDEKDLSINKDGKGKRKSVTKSVNDSKSVSDKTQEKSPSVKENVSSTTNEEEEKLSKKLRRKSKTGTDSDDRESRAMRRTRSQSQDSEETQSSDKESDKAAGKGSDLDTSKSKSSKKSDAKRKPKDNEETEESDEKKSSDTNDDKKEKAKSKTKKSSKKEAEKKTPVKDKSKGNDPDEEDVNSNDTEEEDEEVEDDTDNSEDEDFVVSKTRRSTRKSGNKGN